jgi:hypothetical protein
MLLFTFHGKERRLPEAYHLFSFLIWTLLDLSWCQWVCFYHYTYIIIKYNEFKVIWSVNMDFKPDGLQSLEFPSMVGSVIIWWSAVESNSRL